MPFILFPRLSPRRWLTHAALLGFTAFCYGVGTRYAPNASMGYLLTLSMGYEAMVLIGITLSVGTVMLFRQRRNPVNIMQRRDLGIWAGITGMVHVVLALTLDRRGGVLSFFLRWTSNGYRIQDGLFGISNYVGLIATFILLALLITSNTLSIRILKGKRWKKLQRLNYVLFALGLVHTFGYQIVSRRESPFQTWVLLGAMAVFIIQMIGMYFYAERQQSHQRRKQSHL